MSAAPVSAAASWRLLTRLVAAVAVLLVALVVGTAPALAHSKVDLTAPADGEVLAVSPPGIAIGFNEVVSVPPGSISLLDSAGTTIELPDAVVSPEGADGSRAVVEGVPELSDGWYAVLWSAVSSDGHPIKGTFTFYVGDPSGAGAAEKVDTADVADPAELFRNVAPILRGLTYLSVMLAVGSLAALWALSSSRAPMPAEVLSRARRIAAGAAVVGLVVTPLVAVNNALVLNGGSTEGLGATLQLVLQSSSGASLLVRMSALFGVCTAVLLVMERSTRVIGGIVAFVSGLVLAGSFAMTGHAAVVDTKVIASVAAVVHLLAAALWLGAMPVLAVTFLARRRLKLAQAVEALDRFSILATVSVILVLVGGSTLAVLMFNEPAELLTTEYGLALLAKVVVVSMVALVGAYNHFLLVPALRRSAQQPADSGSDGSGSDGDGLGGVPAGRHMRLTLAVEAGALVVVLVATAVLTSFGAPKAGGAHLEHLGLEAHAHADGPGSLDLDLQLGLRDLEPKVLQAPLGEGELELNYVPGKAGQENRLTLMAFGSDGDLRPITSLKLALSQEALGLGPIERTAVAQPDGTWLLVTRDFGVPGDWTLRVDLEFADGTLDFAELVMPISASDTPATQTGESK